MTTLLKAMEMHKDRLIVVIAGYPDEINGLVQSNTGLTRRFKHFINFPSFSGDELMNIFELNMKKKNLFLIILLFLLPQDLLLHLLVHQDPEKLLLPDWQPHF